MKTIRLILTSLIDVANQHYDLCYKDLDAELLSLSRDAERHLEAANAAKALTIHLDKVPAV